jgi:hypothetical protein
MTFRRERLMERFSNSATPRKGRVRRTMPRLAESGGRKGSIQGTTGFPGGFPDRFVGRGHGGQGRFLFPVHPVPRFPEFRGGGVEPDDGFPISVHLGPQALSEFGDFRVGGIQRLEAEFQPAQGREQGMVRFPERFPEKIESLAVEGHRDLEGHPGVIGRHEGKMLQVRGVQPLQDPVHDFSGNRLSEGLDPVQQGTVDRFDFPPPVVDLPASVQHGADGVRVSPQGFGEVGIAGVPFQLPGPGHQGLAPGFQEILPAVEGRHHQIGVPHHPGQFPSQPPVFHRPFDLGTE